MSYRTIIVDDEPPALAKLSHLLKDHDEFELAGAFNNAEDALNSAKNLKPQVAFVDIAMPGKNGMELAASLRENLSSPIEIIFVTAFDQYAVSAFDIDATDYLLKPVSKERFLRSIQRIKNNLKNTPATPPQSPAFPTQPMVHAFGKLEITGIKKRSRNGGPPKSGSCSPCSLRTALTESSAKRCWIYCGKISRRKRPCPTSIPATTICVSF